MNEATSRTGKIALSLIAASLASWLLLATLCWFLLHDFPVAPALALAPGAGIMAMAFFTVRSYVDKPKEARSESANAKHAWNPGIQEPPETRSESSTPSQPHDDASAMIDHLHRERARVEKSLQQSTERFRWLFEYNPQPMLIFDRETFRIGSVNQAAAHLYGYSEQEFLELRLLDLGPEEDSPALTGFLAQGSGGFTKAGDWRHRKKDGSVIDVEVSGFLGKSFGFITIDDVTARKFALAELEISRRRFKALFDTALEAVLVADDEGRFVDANPAACRLLGYSRVELLRLTAADLAPAENRHLVPNLLKKLLVSGELGGEQIVVRKDGTRLDLEFRAVANILPGLHLSVNRDVTERKRAEVALRESEARFSAFMDNFPGVAFIKDREGRYVYVNQAAAGTRSMSPVQIKGKTDDEILPPETASMLQLNDMKVRQAGEAVRSVEAVPQGGKDRFWLISKFPLSANGAAGVMVGGIGIDITDQKHAEEHLRELSRRLLRLQDEERRRLARELHDSTAQSLTGIIMNLTFVNQSAPQLSEKALESITQSLSLAEQCSREIRSMSYLLHPPLLDELGLVPALHWYAQGFAQRSGIRVDVQASPDLDRLSEVAETALFRIVQECLSNILHHSGSPTASIRILREATGVTLEVCDEGKGISQRLLKKLRGGHAGMGIGIIGMRERVRQLNGDLQIDSNGSGTTVRASLPIR